MLGYQQVQDFLKQAQEAAKQTKESFFYTKKWNESAKKLQVLIEQNSKTVGDILLSDPTVRRPRPSRPILIGEARRPAIDAPRGETLVHANTSQEVAITMMQTRKQQQDQDMLNFNIHNGLINHLLEMQRTWQLDRRCYELVSSYFDLIIKSLQDTLVEQEELLRQTRQPSEQFTALSGGQLNALYDLIYLAVDKTPTFFRWFRNKTLMEEISLMKDQLASMRDGIKHNIEGHISAQISGFHSDVADVSIKVEDKKLRADKVDLQKLRELFVEFAGIIKRVLNLQKDHRLNIYFYEFVKSFLDQTIATFQVILNSNRILKLEFAREGARAGVNVLVAATRIEEAETKREDEHSVEQLRTIAMISHSPGDPEDKLRRINALTQGMQPMMMSAADESRAGPATRSSRRA